MKKAIVLITALLMLAASSAFAAVTPEFPAYWNATSAYKSGSNGTVMYITGFGFNQTSGIKHKNDSMSFMNSTKQFFTIDTVANKAGFNGTTSFSNSTEEAIKVLYVKATNKITLNQNIGNVNGLATVATGAGVVDPFNATQYFVPAGNYQAMFGLTNSSYNNTVTGAAHTDYENFAVGRGLSMLSVFANGSFDGVSSSSDVWSYYAYGLNAINGKPQFIVGQVEITTDGGNNNAKAKFYVSNGSVVDNTENWITYNATGIDAKNNMALTREDGITLMSNSTINVDENLIVGRVAAAGGITAATRNPMFVIMIKNGSELTSDDLTGRAYRQVYSGLGYGTKSLANATGGFLQYSINDAEKIDGDVAVSSPTHEAGVSADVAFEAASIDGYTVNLESTSQFGLAQSNMTISDTDGNAFFGFYGLQNAEKTFAIGIAEDISKNAYGLTVLVPASASTGPITAAGAAYQNNSSLATHGLVLNSTGYTKTGLRAVWSGVPESFSPLTEVKGFNATFTETQKGSLYYTFQYPFDGIGEKVSKLRLYKLFPNSDATVREYSYASSADPANDGSWWISSSTGDGYMASSSMLVPAETYYVNYVVKDNGNYDYKDAAMEIGDPVVLGTQPESSSSSSSGCVFNPAAGFGLEWLLLMFAPMVAIVRSRCKK